MKALKEILEKSVEAFRRKIKVEVPVTGVQGITLEIDRLEDVKKQDVLNRTREFKRIMQLCKFDDEKWMPNSCRLCR